MVDRYEYSECFRYRISIVDTATDEVVAVKYAKHFTGIKRRIAVALRQLGHPKYRAKDNPYFIYVYDSEFEKDEGMDRLEELAIDWPIDWDEVMERGIDFDVWYEDILTDEERKEYVAFKI